MKTFLILCTMFSLAFTISSAEALKRKKKTVVKYKDCPLAVVEGMSISQDCRNTTRICPLAVEQNSLLHSSCTHLTKRCPSVSSSIPPGCNSVTTLRSDSTTGEALPTGGIKDNLNWACTTDNKGVGTCKTQEKCTMENNVRRCRKCSETISLISTPIKKSASCKTDADCVLVNADCCGCQSGGSSIAVHKSDKKSYNSALKKTCSTSTPANCSASYRCNTFQAYCHNSQCATGSAPSGGGNSNSQQ